MTNLKVTAEVIHQFPERWDELSHHIGAALERSGDDTHDLGDVLRAILRDDAQWWPGARSAIVTEIETTPRKLILRYWLAGGDLNELKTMTRQIEAWAVSKGCRGAIIVGRGGWPKGLGPPWKTQYTVSAKDL